METLGALVIVNIVLIGFLHSQQQHALRADELAAHAFAASALNDMAAYLTMNPDAASGLLSDYGSPPPGAPACEARACTGAELARHHLAKWKCRFAAWREHAACADATSADRVAGDARVQRRGALFVLEARARVGEDALALTVSPID